MAGGEAEAAGIMAGQHGMISARQQVAAGMARTTRRRRQAAGLLVPVQPGVYRTTAQPDTWRGRLLAACLSTGGLASHRSAAALWGLGSVKTQLVEVTVAKSSVHRRSTVKLHESTQMHLADARRVDGIPLTGPARTLLDLAAVVPPSRLEDAVDDALRLRLVTWPDLYSTLVEHSARGRRGCGPLRRLLDERYGDQDIPLSTWSRQVARLFIVNGIRPPALEHRIVDGDGGLLAQVDLAYPAEKIVIELQSARWHLNRRSFDDDPARWNELTIRGWRVFPVTWSMYSREPARLCRLVADALARSSSS